MNKCVKVVEEERMGCRVGWTLGAAGLGQRLTRSREGGHRKQQGIVLIHQALGDTLKHIHAFTH